MRKLFIRAMNAGALSVPRASRIVPGRVAVCILLLAVCRIWPGPPAHAADVIDLGQCAPAETRLYLALAKASEAAYDDSRPGLERTPSGCVALVTEDGDGNLVIAFRGSMLADRTPEHPFSSLGGANMRRNYRDWVATNLKQASGFLPRQYTEAAVLVEKHVREHPVDKLVFVTGHSKGGGAATYAHVAASLSPIVSARQAGRMRCVTFNAAVVRERNWRRLYRELGRNTDASRKELAAGSIHALCMRDDPVSKIAASEERACVKRIVIVPTAPHTPNQQHGIDVVIAELAERAAARD